MLNGEAKLCLVTISAVAAVIAIVLLHLDTRNDSSERDSSSSAILPRASMATEAPRIFDTAGAGHMPARQEAAIAPAAHHGHAALYGNSVSEDEEVVLEVFLAFSRWLRGWETGQSDLATGLSLARERAPAMKQLMKTNPSLAYECAISEEVWRRLPAELQQHVERRFTENGLYTVRHDCSSDAVFRSLSTETISHLHTSISPSLAGRGDYRGQLSGVVFDRSSALVSMDKGADPAKSGPPIAPAPASGAFTILWLNIKYSDETGYPTEGRIDLVKDQLEAYSYNRLSVSYVVLDVAITSAVGIAAADLRSEADAAAILLGEDPADHSVTVYRSSNIGNFANVGGDFTHVQEASSREDVAVHEIGHCMGLSHANWWQPNAGEPAWGSGTNVTYGEHWGMMAIRAHTSQMRSDFNAPHKKLLGWLDAGTDYEDDVASGIYRIYPYDDHAGNFSTAGVDAAYYGVTVFKDTQAVNGEENVRRYFLSFRNQPEKDSAFNPWFSSGICLHWEPWTRNGSDGYNSNGPYGSTVVDAHPHSAGLGTYDGFHPALDVYDAPILIGETYLDDAPGNSNGPIRITPLRKNDPDGDPRSGDEYIDVKIIIGTQSGNQAPTGTLNMAVNSAQTGESVTLTAVAGDPDDTQLGYLWDFGLGTTGTDRALMPLDGEPVQSYSWNEPGTYTVSVTVNDGRGGSLTMSDEISITGDPIILPKPVYWEWDAAQDLPGDDKWYSSSINDYAWTFDGGALSPENVSNSKFTTITKAYRFPAALDVENAAWDEHGSTDPASFELVLDVDADNGIIFETGAAAIGFAIDIKQGSLRAHVGSSASISTPLSAEERNDFIHVVVVADNINDNLELYIDGTSRVSTAWTAAEDWSGGNLAGFGGNNGAGIAPANVDLGDLSGRVALFRFYRNTALGASDVGQKYDKLLGSAADLDFDGMWDEWEISNFGNTNYSDGTGDDDQDGFVDLHEYLAGTSPTNSSSLLGVTDIQFDLNSNKVVIAWQAVSNKTYMILKRDNISDSVWTTNEANILGIPPLCVRTIENANVTGYYRITLEE